MFFFGQKSINNLPHQMLFLIGVRVQFLDQVKYLGVWINASLKDDDDQGRTQGGMQGIHPPTRPKKVLT